MPELKALIDKEPSHVAWMYQHGNARTHTAGIVTQYLKNKEAAWEGRLQVLDWPSQSPDLNPIENSWGYIKKKLRKRTVKPSSLDRLFEFILEEWKAVPGADLGKHDRVSAPKNRTGNQSKGGKYQVLVRNLYGTICVYVNMQNSMLKCRCEL